MKGAKNVHVNFNITESERDGEERNRSQDTVYSSFLDKFESLPSSKALWPSVASWLARQHKKTIGLQCSHMGLRNVNVTQYFCIVHVGYY